MADETKRVDVFMGPYRGNLLTMSTADADAAINAHWARDPFVPYDAEHGALSEEDRAAALEAANTWARAQWDAVGEPPPEPPAEGGTARKRAMSAEEPANYKTRGR